MTRLRIIVHVALLALFTHAGPGDAIAQSPDEFYKGKTVHLLIGFGVGGDDDLWARAIAKHMTRHMRGNPVIVPQNIPGAAGLVLANRLFNASPRDGTAFGLINRSIPFEPLLDGQGAQFDPLKMNWIGSPSRDTAVCAARKDATVQKLEDLFGTELRVGATGSATESSIYPEFLSTLVGLKFKVVKGYSGSREITLAMERNEVQGTCISYEALVRSSFFRDLGANILLQASLEVDSRLKNVPAWVDLARSEEDREILRLIGARAAVGRPFVAPPGVPSDRIAALRQAFEDTLRDPAFLDDARAQNLNVVPVTAGQIERIIAAAYKSSPEVVRRTVKALGRTN